MSGVSSTDLVLGRANGLANITVKSGTTEVGGSTDAAALASRVKTLETHYLAHTHSGVTTGVGSTGVTAGYTPQSFDSARLKVGG